MLISVFRSTVLATCLAAVLSAEAADNPPLLTVPFDAEQATAAQVAWAKRAGKPGPLLRNSIGMEFVLIPPGRFRMGVLDRRRTIVQMKSRSRSR